LRAGIGFARELDSVIGICIVLFDVVVLIWSLFSNDLRFDFFSQEESFICVDTKDMVFILFFLKKK
jgi:hypothetical protein